MARIIKVITIAASVALYLFPPSSQWVERHYSERAYPLLQTWITPISNWFPLPIADVLVLALALGLPVWWVVRLKAAGKGRRGRAFGLLVFNTAVLASVIFLLFEILWGLNYSREPLSRKLDYDQKRITRESVISLAALSTNRLNAESPEAHSSPWPDDSEWARRLLPSFNAVVTDLGDSRAIAPARGKHSIFNLYLESAGIDGFTDPFGLDVVLNKDLLPIEKPFALAHEWAHLAGFADESEANFIAMLTCVRSEDAVVRYAGWLDLYPRLPHAKPSEDGTPSGTGAPPQTSTPSASSGTPQPSTRSGSDGVEPPLAPEVESDLRAIQARLAKQISPWLSSIQWRFYNRFLKANGVQAGVASYGLFIRLLLGTKFEAGWVPVIGAK
ncbi:MAG TPA: DUF3810 family protein [Blastocatellia bacterium]|jgi:hypothetical protein|nr:DUF3810 family protein [Blastocatellia bacterium]